MTEGRGSGELEGSTLGSSSREGDGTRRSRRTLSSGSFLVDSSFLPKSRSLRISSHRPRRTEPDRNEKRGAPESDIVVSKKRSRFPWNRNRDSLGGSSVIANSAENASLSERSGSPPARRPTPPDPQPPRANNTEPAVGLDQDSLHIVNLALNLSDSRRRNNLPRSASTRQPGSGWTGAPGQAPVCFPDTATRGTGGNFGYHGPHTRRNFTQTSGLPPGSRGEAAAHEPSSVLDLLPSAAAGETLPPVFSESTLARTERARRHFDLFHLYLRLLPSLPPLRHHGMHDAAGGSSASNDALSPGRVYNPLQAIRDRKIRFRERRPIDPELDGWYDVDRVHEWVESVRSQYGETSHMSTECLKLPPFRRGRRDSLPEGLDEEDILAASPPSSLRRISRTSSMKARRPRFDWIISPTELLADAAWVEEGRNKAKIVDNNGSLLYPNPSELSHAGLGHFTPHAESQQPGKPVSDYSHDYAHAPSSTASLSDTHPALGPGFKSVNRGRRRHRLQSASHSPHSRSVSMSGMGTRERKVGLRSSSTSSISTTGDKSFWYRNSKEYSRVSRARDSKAKQSIAMAKEDHGHDTKNYPLQTPRADYPSWAKVDGRNGSLSSAASADQRLDPFSSALLTTTSSSHAPLGYFPSIASNLSPPSSRSPSPSKRHFAHGIISRHERSKSRSRLHEVVPDNLASGAIPADDPANISHHRARKLESSPLPNYSSPLYQDERVQTHAQKGSIHPESRFRGLLKGPGKIAERVGNEVSKMGDRILKIDSLAHSRNSSLETSVPSEGSTLDDIDEMKDEKKSVPKGLLRRLPPFSDETPRKNPEKVPTKNLMPPWTTPSRRSDPDEERRASQNATPVTQGPGTPFYDAIEPQEKSFAAADSHSKHDVPASIGKIGEGRKFEPEFHTVREQIKKGRIKDPSVPFSMTRPPVTGLAQAEPTAAGRRRDGSTQSRTWSISNRSISSAKDSGIPDEREIERTRALLLTSGIKAREITRRAELVRMPPPEFLQKAFGRGNPVPQVVRRYEFDVAAQGLLQRFEKTHRQLQRSVDRFPADSAPLKTQLAQLEDMINHSLAPRVRAATDDADKLSVDLNTTSTLAVKQLGDKLDKSIRKRHRRLRWLRRTGFVMLEWALVGMLWWVWLIVMAFKVLRGVLRGALTGIRWVLWL